MSHSSPQNETRPTQNDPTTPTDKEKLGKIDSNFIIRDSKEEIHKTDSNFVTTKAPITSKLYYQHNISLKANAGTNGTIHFHQDQRN